jgi:hypothetical protein
MQDYDLISQEFGDAHPALPLILDAILGGRGEDQKIIATKGVEWIDLLLRKNRDYGSSAWREPVLMPGFSPRDAMLVRMSDKVQRIHTLLSGQGRPEVQESIEDTIRDLGAYCLLWLACPES